MQIDDAESKYVTCLVSMGEPSPRARFPSAPPGGDVEALSKFTRGAEITLYLAGIDPSGAPCPPVGGHPKKIPPEQARGHCGRPPIEESGAQWPRSQSCMGIKDSVAHAAARTTPTGKAMGRPAHVRNMNLIIKRRHHLGLHAFRLCLQSLSQESVPARHCTPTPPLPREKERKMSQPLI